MVVVAAGVIIEIPPAPAAGLMEMELDEVVLESLESDLLSVLLSLLLSVSVPVVFSSFPVLVLEALSEAEVEAAVSLAEVSVVLSRIGGQLDSERREWC